MYETSVTVVGRLITPFQTKTFPDGTLKINARMACTERRVDRTTGEWADGQTLFLTVVCKRGLAENANASLRSGDRLVAHGRLYTREYEVDGKPRSTLELDAWSLGPDLQWCTAVITKRPRSTAAPVTSGDTAAGSALPDEGSSAVAPVGATQSSVWDPGLTDERDGHRGFADPDVPDGLRETVETADTRVGEAAVGV